MAAPPLTTNSWPQIRTRLEQIPPDARPQFGKMNPTEMMRHMRNVHEAALEEIEQPNSYIPVVSPLVFFLITRVITRWPGGKLRAPEYWTPPPEFEFHEERQRLFDVVDRFVQAVEEQPTRVTRNPIFGRLKLRDWSRLNGLHFEHHLRQFGV